MQVVLFHVELMVFAQREQAANGICLDLGALLIPCISNVSHHLLFACLCCRKHVHSIDALCLKMLPDLHDICVPRLINKDLKVLRNNRSQMR